MSATRQHIMVKDWNADIRHLMIKPRQYAGNGIKVRVLRAEEFGGEYDRRSWAYTFVLWLVSYWAMLTNYVRAIFIKIFKNPKNTIKLILWKMGRDSRHVSSFAVDWLSSYNHEAKCGAAGWKALTLFYNYHKTIKPKLNGDLEGFLTRYWIEKMENRQAVTNRMKIAVRLLVESFRKFSHESEIRLISIASGSAQAVIEAMSECAELNIKAVLIDVDETALAEARRQVEKCGLEDRFQIVRGAAQKFRQITKQFRPHIVEMVGFLDYLNYEKATALISGIRSSLCEGGILITCNISPNKEKPFLDHALLWPMIYRRKEELANIIRDSGFPPHKAEIIYEPFKIHGIAYCCK